MAEEKKILRENIKIFRHLLTEAVGESDIVKYIQNHEYVYIYYGGDDTNKRGYRTIRPYVLGTNKSGNQVLRAWQDRGKSVSFATRPTRSDSYEHDYWDENGAKPGWRMFRLDKIEKVYPTGKKFNNPDGTVMIPPKYNEGSDGDMTSIIAYVSSKREPDFVPKEVQPTTGEKRTKWDNFSRGNKNNRKITADDVVKLRDIASRVYKKKLGSWLVVINNDNEFDIINVNDKNKVPQQAIVGNLPNLYDTLVNSNKQDDRFFKNTLNQTQNQLKEEELSTIPYKKKTFFK